jgi:hypothetical protein
MIGKLKLITVLAIGLLTACSDGKIDLGGNADLLADMRKIIKDRREARNPTVSPTKLTRANLNAVTVPILQVSIENTDATALLEPIAYRNDRTAGRVTVWKTAEGEHVVLRSGVLIGTKGLGRDLASTNAAATLVALRTRSSRQGTRSMYIRDDVNGGNEIRMQCQISTVGPQTITIVEKSYRTLHLNEECTFDSGTISNDYWIDSAGTVRQSKQWAGPDLGYFSIRLLNK